MILTSYILRNLSNLCHGDYEPLHLLLTLSLAAPAVAWYAWMLLKNSSAAAMPPGPPGLPLLGNLPFLGTELHSSFASLSGKYGPIMSLRLGTKVAIVVSSPELAREVLRDHDAAFANRDVPDLARAAAASGGADIVFSPYGPVWQMLRKICVREVLGGATLAAVYGLRQHEIRSMVRSITGRGGSPVNVGEEMFSAALNAITAMLWGETVRGEERASVAVEFRQVVAEAMGLLGKANLADFFPGLGLGWFDLQGLKKEMMGLVRTFNQIFDRIIDQGRKREDGEKCKDFLQVLLQLTNDGDGKTPLTTSHLKLLFMDMVLGGTETTANAVEFAMAEMMNNPEVLKKAQDELDEVVGKNGRVEESHISQLPYLQAVMKEALRLHPVLPLMVPHCPSSSHIIGGYPVPTGARVFVNVWAIQRDPLVWERPLEFCPERFLGVQCGFRGGSNFSYFPFGSGRRMCAGVAMAERMFLFSIASLLHTFDWKLPEGEKLDLSEKFGIVLKMRKPLMAIPTPRLYEP